MSNYRIGVDVGGTKVAYGIFDSEGKLIDKYTHKTPKDIDGPHLVDLILETINEITDKNSVNLNDILGIGICLPSFINFKEEYIYTTSSIKNVRDFAIGEYIASHSDIPAIIDNDANVAALAEHIYGAGVGCDDMVYLATSTGFGGGLILNNSLYRGSYGWAGECGHMLITPDEGVGCGCENKGCFESWAGGLYIKDQVKKKAENMSTIIDLEGEINGEVLFEACQNNDKLALEIVEQMGYYMGVCIYNIYRLLNVNTFVFGGGLTGFGPLLYDKVEETFKRYNKLPLEVRFKFAELKNDFGIIGACELTKELG